VPDLTPRRAPDGSSLQITGGFGDATGEGDYFALDGEELKEKIRQLLDKVNDALDGDLRLSMAVCYPEVRVSVAVTVTGHPADVGFVIEKGLHEGDAGTIAAAERVVGHALPEEHFAITADHDEKDAPPDQVREELGLEVPRKQRIVTGIGPQIVDRVRH
jgi:hypothetical protein